MNRPNSPRLRSRAVVALGGLALAYGVLPSGSSTAALLVSNATTVLAFALAVAGGELFRLRMPSGRDAAPLASASALALALVGIIQGEPTFDVPAGVVVLVVALGLALAAVVRRASGRTLGMERAAALLVGVAVAAALAREVPPGGDWLWDLPLEPQVLAVAMVAIAAVGVLVEVVLTSAVRSERQRTPWLPALRSELGEVAPLTYAVVTSGPLVALMAPPFGLASLPAALFPLAITYVAVDRYARNRMTYRQTIATLSHLTEKGGYTPAGHAERVANLSVRLGRVLGMSDPELRDVEYAALLHDLGQISLREPIPGGATVLAAPADQRDIAAEGAGIVRHAEGLDVVADYIEAQTTPYRQVRELGEPVPIASRVIKVANAFDDLTGGRGDPVEQAGAIERIQLGLGYEYDPEVVRALTVATSDRLASVDEWEPAGR